MKEECDSKEETSASGGREGEYRGCARRIEEEREFAERRLWRVHLKHPALVRELEGPALHDVKAVALLSLFNTMNIAEREAATPGERRERREEMDVTAKSLKV